MTMRTNGASDYPLGAAPETLSETRPIYWSIRRELWENRSIVFAPLIVMAVVLFASLINILTLPHQLRTLSADDPSKLIDMAVAPFGWAPAPIMFATLLVGFYYSLDALYGERRDRSILFWKSLPVSDRTAVLCKASIPLVVLPLIGYVLSVVTQIIMLPLSLVVLTGSAVSPLDFWTELRYFQGLVIMCYGLGVHALWFAPVYGWLMMVSAWAKRAPFLWALIPLLAMAAIERLALGSWSFMTMLENRMTGAMQVAFVMEQGYEGDFDRLTQLTPMTFLSAPGLWIGLVFAAVFVAIAIRLRRYRDPI